MIATATGPGSPLTATTALKGLPWRAVDDHICAPGRGQEDEKNALSSAE
jgi:hypothetical protein